MVVWNSGRPRPEEHEAHVPVVGGGVGSGISIYKAPFILLKGDRVSESFLETVHKTNTTVC